MPSTYNDTSDTPGWVAASLQVLGDNGKDTGRQRHVEQAVRLWPSLLQVLEVVVQNSKGLILVVLAGNVSAQAGEFLELLLNLWGRRLDV